MHLKTSEFTKNQIRKTVTGYWPTGFDFGMYLKEELKDKTSEPERMLSIAKQQGLKSFFSP
ncbi:hypothetical protein [Fluviicola sp.]|jgi:hypothetical protein|uniref:hypothetical protein n=1 Tax=Fluviicola sp. TaxID=1917219 RepID=UPI002821C949|nr:hypothetical protein [Fluviicola sp.]MDR0801138.1 hypothetical protein [Fluviicola sp.]